MEDSKYVTWEAHNSYAEKIESEFARRDDENTRQNKRISSLEDNVKQIQQLTVSVEKMAVSMQNMVKSQNDMTKSLEKQGERLDKIEKEPADKWKQASWIVISVILTALITFSLSRIGI